MGLDQIKAAIAVPAHAGLNRVSRWVRSVPSSAVPAHAGLNLSINAPGARVPNAVPAHAGLNRTWLGALSLPLRRPRARRAEPAKHQLRSGCFSPSPRTRG